MSIYDDLLPADTHGKKRTPPRPTNLDNARSVNLDRTMPDYIRRILDESSGADRSAQTHAAVCALLEAGYSDAEVHRLMADHQPTIDKGDTERHVDLILTKQRPLHDHAGSFCADADCPHTPNWQRNRPTNTHARGMDTKVAVPEPAQPDVTVLDDRFWTARPFLDHIRRAAHSRLVSAEALLAVVLARVAAITPPDVKLPPITGAAAPLNYCAGLIAKSGVGKSQAKAVGVELLPIALEDAAYVLDDRPPGSGEGLVDLYMGTEVEEGADGKKHRVRKQIRRGAFVYADEGELLTELGNRKGSTILQTIRSMWSGQTVGSSNASDETTRLLPAGRYAFGLVIAAQPTRAGGIIRDAVGGTPQRFLWAQAKDPTAHYPATAPEWPGTLRWRPPHGSQQITVDRVIAETIGNRRAAILRGEQEVDELDSHRDLVRLKTAALLTLLDGRTHVEVDDWTLAGRLLTRSDAVRAGVLEDLRLEALDTENASTAKAVRRAETLAESQAESVARYVEQMAGTIYRAVATHQENGKCPTGCPRYHLTSAPSGKWRQRASVDEAIECAEGHDWIVRTGDRWTTGSSRPK